MSGQRAELTEEQLEQLKTVFKFMDEDGSGTLERDELGTALSVCGLNLPGYSVRHLLDDYDVDADGKISLSEFKKIYADVKDKQDFGKQYKVAVRARTNIETHGGTSEASVEGTTHTESNEERVAFTDWINKSLADDKECEKLVPFTSDHLYDKCKDGILLCKLINTAVPNTIDERAINRGNLSQFTIDENLVLALQSAQAVGCNIINIRPSDIRTGKRHLLLGLLWQIIRIGLLSEITLSNHPGLAALLEEGETLDDLRKLSPEQILLRWVNYHLSNAGIDRRITNFGNDIKDSEAYTYLLHQIAPKDKGVRLVMDLPDGEERAEGVLEEADKIDCRSFVTAKDIVKGNKKLNLAFVANLFNTYPALEKPDNIDEEVVEETREEKTYRNWMNSMGVKPFVTYLYSDLQDGNVIFQLYEKIKPGCVNWNRVITQFNKMKKNFQKLENCNYCVDLGKQMKFSLVGIGGEDIRDGNQTLTLALVWQLMRAYTLALLSSLNKDGSAVGDRQIIEWANTLLKENGKPGAVTGFQDKALSDGKIIIDLIDCIKPHTIKHDLVKEGTTTEEKLSNAKYAVSMGRKIGARIYALPEDIVEVKPKMIMTIFACLMYKDRQKGSQGDVQQSCN